MIASAHERADLDRAAEAGRRDARGEIEVAEEADQTGEDAPPLVAEDLLDDR